MVRNSHKEDQSIRMGLLCGYGYLEDGFEPIAVQTLVATFVFAKGKNPTKQRWKVFRFYAAKSSFLRFLNYNIY